MAGGLSVPNLDDRRAVVRSPAKLRDVGPLYPDPVAPHADFEAVRVEMEIARARRDHNRERHQDWRQSSDYQNNADQRVSEQKRANAEHTYAGSYGQDRDRLPTVPDEGDLLALHSM